MAQPEIKAGLSSDPSKVNPTGASQADLGEYQKSLEEQINSLEQRYANPNWFKVAAGFLKPQLGGFAASLGSASEAMGESVEQGKAAALPIAQMRSQLAQSKILTGQKKTQSDEFEAWRASGKPMDQATFSRISSLDPSSQVAEAAKAAYEGQRKDLEFTSAQQRLMMDAIVMKQAKGMPLSKPEQDFLSNLPSQLSLRQEAKPILPGGQPVGAEGPAGVRTSSERAQGDIAALNKELSRIPAGDPRRQILEHELQQAKQRAGEAPESTEPTKPSKPAGERETLYPRTFTFPETANMSDQEREAAKTAYMENAKVAEGRSEAQVNQWRSLASEPAYSALNSEYQSSIDLIKNNPTVAKKVFNLLRGNGDLLNQVASAAQAGMGINLGSMAANVNLPTEAFVRAGLNHEEQLMADRLVRGMITVGNAKLASQGISPEKGQETYNKFLESTKASLQQNPATALHNLQKDYVTFQQNKHLYDNVAKEYARQAKSGSPTPYTDVLTHSPHVARINAEARERMHEHESDYQEAIRQATERRKAAGVR